MREGAESLPGGSKKKIYKKTSREELLHNSSPPGGSAEALHSFRTQRGGIQASQQHRPHTHTHTQGRVHQDVGPWAATRYGDMDQPQHYDHSPYIFSLLW